MGQYTINLRAFIDQFSWSINIGDIVLEETKKPWKEKIFCALEGISLGWWEVKGVIDNVILLKSVRFNKKNLLRVIAFCKKSFSHIELYLASSSNSVTYKFL